MDLETNRDPPIQFIDFDTFRGLNGFCRCPDDQHYLVSVENIDRDKSLLVFVSHCWLRGLEFPPHPDTINGDKFRLCVEGLDRIYRKLAPRAKKCYLWLDYSCSNQNSKDLSETLKRYDKIVEICDAVFTPIVDHDHLTWSLSLSLSNKGENLFEEYGAPSWKTYLGRAWCRVEMMYAANISVVVNKNEDTKRQGLFENVLAQAFVMNVRPHFLYGTKELNQGQDPIVLPPLQDSWFEKYSPLEGNLTEASDIDHIHSLVNMLQSYMDLKRKGVGYVGERNEAYEKHGQGTERYPNGFVYQGSWVRGVREGHGVLRELDDISVYEGEWKNGKQCGHGVLRRRNCVYIGDFADDKKNGFGVFSTGGNEYSGEWKNDKHHGKGVYKYADGGCYDGFWINGNREGKGLIVFADGSKFEGEIYGSKRVGTLTAVDGSTKQGTWEYGFRIEGDTTTLSDGVYEGQFSLGQPDGYGTCYYRSGNTFEGSWILGTPKCGTFKYVDGSLQDKSSRPGHVNTVTSGVSIYEGSFSNYGRRHGRGVCRYANGSEYDGEWSYDQRQGIGRCKYADGAEYSGKWYHDKWHGHGKYVDAVGVEQVGHWVEGLFSSR